MNLIITTTNKVATITINRPEVKNALNLSCIQDLMEAFKKNACDKNINCIILTGQNKEAFCSGADLKEFSQKTTLKEKNEYFEALANLITTIKECPKPVICKVHGYALAGGLALVAASDIVLAANDAKFSLPEHKVGMIPGIVMVALSEIINKRNLDYLCLTADIIDADEALQIGLVSKIYGKSVLDKKTSELAENISSFSSYSVATTKRMLSSGSCIKSRLNIRSKEMSAYSLSPACIEGISAYLEKRKPDWND